MSKARDLAVIEALTDLDGITDGTNGQVLTTDGSGTFTFTSVTDFVSAASGGTFSGNIDVTGTVTADAISLNPTTGYANIEMGGPDGSYIDLKSPFSDDYDGRIITTGTDLNITTGSGSGSVVLQHQDATKLNTTATGVDVTGVAKASLGFQFGNSYLYEGATDQVNMRIGTDGPYLEFVDAGSDVAEVGNASGPLALTASGTEHMRIDSSGNVGIGTSTPSALLNAVDASGSGTATQIASGTAHSQTRFAARTDGYNGIMSLYDSGGTEDVKLSAKSGQASYINNGGNVGIGTDSPSVQLETNSDGFGHKIEGVIASNYSIHRFVTDTSDDAKFIIGYGASHPTTPHQVALKATNAAGTVGFYTGGNSQRMRIASGGQVSIGTTDSSHKLHTKETGNAIANRFQNSFATLTNVAPIVYVTADRANSSAYYLLETRSGGTADREHVLRGDGSAFADGSWQGGGADYAEYFEWADGNTSNEDRRGYSVVLVGNQIRKATSSDSASDIIGVISGNPSVVGDAAWNKWDGKYNTDDFGAYIFEAYTVTEWIEADGTEHSYETDKIPSDLVAPATATVITTDEDGATLARRQLNTSYDDSQTYTPREDRVEWDTVGLMGKLRLRVGQPTGSNWIKMRDTATDNSGNVTIEEWLVR